MLKPSIAIAGASGFVGKALIDSLQGEFPVVALGRKIPANEARPVEWRKADLFSAGDTAAALQGVDVAIYLVHSMVPSSRLFQGDFHDTDLLLADNFAQACRSNGVKRILYLGGLVPEGHISRHLASRLEVEGVLRASGVPVTVLRAGMIVGPGGSSFEILRSLVERLPLMVLPRWTASTTQAIHVDDVVRVLREAAVKPSFEGRTFDLVNGENLTYRSILERTAAFLGKKRFFLPVPISSTGFSKLWVQLFGSSTKELVSPLIDSLLCDFPAHPPVREIRELVQYRDFESMLKATYEAESSRPRKRKHGAPPRDHTVRSIQRLPSVPLDSHELAVEYMRWLPRFFRALIRVEVKESSGEVSFRTFLRKPLLKLRYVREQHGLDREKLHIVGGLLSRTTDTGWLEFRQVEGRKFTLVSIHEFVPRLPWPLYVCTQAPLHRFVMLAFGRHLRRSFSPATGPSPKL